MKKKTPIVYDYIVHPISQDDSAAYKAVIPAFSAVVYGDSLEELEAGVRFTIEEEIREQKQKKRTLPKKDTATSYSGKFVVRIPPAFHERLALEAKARKKSLNTYIKEKLTVC